MRTPLSRARNAAIVIAGAVLAAIKGRDFWQFVQTGDGPLERLGRGYLARQSRLFRDYFIKLDESDRDRLGDETIRQLTNDGELAGFGSFEYEHHDDKPLADQNRTLILPWVRRALAENGGATVELGTGNGDVVAMLATEYPAIAFTGADFVTATAQRKHILPNLSFRAGYGLDMIEDGTLSGTNFFASSSLCLFAPKELARYLGAIRRAGFQDVLLCELTSHFPSSNDARAFSHHIGGRVWFHNYAGYLREAGFAVRDFKPFQFPTVAGKHRPVILVWGSTRAAP